MRHHKDRRPPCLIQFLKGLKQRLRRPGVERPRRLVRQKELRMVDERPRAGAALLLPTRDLIGKLVAYFPDAKQPHHLLAALLDLLSALVLERHRKRDILFDRQRVEQIVILKHKPQILLAESGELVWL